MSNNIKDSVLFTFEPQKEQNITAEQFVIEINPSGQPHASFEGYTLSPGDYIMTVKLQADTSTRIMGRLPVKIFSKTYSSLGRDILTGVLAITLVLVFLNIKKIRSVAVDVPEEIPDNGSVQLSKSGNDPANNILHTQKFDFVTVLFADIKDFSEITERIPPEELLSELNDFFSYFDTIVDRYHIEKIKTMGDAYMCAGGIPQKNHTNPIDVILAAIEVQNHLNKLRLQKPNLWMIRIGIHTGPVIGGILGHKKLSFDIWGHTVNVASRMESSCEVGRIKISGTTYELVKSFFDCEYSGHLQEDPNNISYYVNGLRPEYSKANANGELKPNNLFFLQMQQIRLRDLEAYVKLRLDTEAPNLYFHNIKHTQEVYEQVEQLGHSMGVDDEEMLLLKTAALFHDIGYILSYNEAPAMSEQLVREVLPQYQYSEAQIDLICQLMHASHYESKPVNILEQIMHDANFMYYRHADFRTYAMNLFREEQEHHQVKMSENEWMRIQTERQSNHRFYTATAPGSPAIGL